MDGKDVPLSLVERHLDFAKKDFNSKEHVHPVAAPSGSAGCQCVTNMQCFCSNCNNRKNNSTDADWDRRSMEFKALLQKLKVGYLSLFHHTHNSVSHFRSNMKIVLTRLSAC